MIYAGVDVHKKFSFITAMNDKGKVINRTKIMHGKEIKQAPWKDFTDQFNEPLSLAIEATGLWFSVHEALEPLVKDIKLSHPLKTRAIAEARMKTDKIDSTMLAHLLRTDLLPVCYVPPKGIRDGRELLRYRVSLVSVQTQIKNKIHALLHRCGYFYEGTDLFGKNGRTWLLSLSLRTIYQEEVGGYLRILDFLKQEIKLTTQKIHTQVELTPQAQLICSIYGMGKYLSLLITMEIGDIKRFMRPANFVSYCGLAPSVHSSGGKTRYGSITKQGSKWLRWALILATQRYKNHKGALGNFYRKITYRHGSKAARIALARKLATIIWHMLSKNEPFKEQNIIKYLQKCTVSPMASDR